MKMKRERATELVSLTERHFCFQSCYSILWHHFNFDTLCPLIVYAALYYFLASLWPFDLLVSIPYLFTTHAAVIFSLSSFPPLLSFRNTILTVIVSVSLILFRTPRTSPPTIITTSKFCKKQTYQDSETHFEF
jgi:hypothetical protein